MFGKKKKFMLLIKTSANNFVSATIVVTMKYLEACDHDMSIDHYKVLLIDNCSTHKQLTN